ncbi:DUF1552 domain-containing protein [Polyangium sp. y55x31]|uniref:DUF1552 domain-containing protein n=1 Tax=Polyangium sp. y55x31 TaxID=3042688 RepID=UPI00248239BB|nr:DUF1552 domain-containing protein [Polyangium sp. y55x31]MDI1477344.1 DUF1552 domain-containing protein [Polyangium sp. y55x31]
MKTTPLSRRTFLRGAVGGTAVALALPTLEAMLGSRGAEAASTDPIFGIFFWGGGLPWHDGHGAPQAGHPDVWTPSTTGKDYTPSELLAPLAPYQPSVITGLTPHTEVPDSPPGQSDGHMRGFMVSMTGDRIRPEGFDHPSHTLTALRPTLDQYVAKHKDFYGPESPRFRSLILGASTARFHDYGHWNAISYNGPDDLNPPILDPGQLYDLLFGVAADTAGLKRRALLLDAVMEDAKSLSSRVGAADKQRIEAHLDHLNAVKNRLDFSGEACAPPGKPAPNGDLIAKTEIMGSLLASALACNMTRVFSFMLSSPATTHVFSNLGVPNDFHATVHEGAWEHARAGILYQMQAFAAFLGRLQAVVEPTGGTLLDRALVFGLSEYGEGYQHSVAEMPCVLAGGANGKIRRNVHVRDPGGNYSKAHVTMLRGVGLETPSFGWNGGQTSEAFGDILV